MRGISRRRVTVGAFIIACLNPLPMCAQDNSQPMLARHLAWLGGPAALQQLGDLTWNGHLTAAGLDGPLMMRETRSGWRRRDVTLGPVSTTDVLGPEGAWALNWTGQVEARSVAAAANDRQAWLRDYGRHLLDPAAAERSDLGIEERDGRSWHVVRFAFPTGDYFDLFLNPDDGGLRWMRERQDTKVFWTRLGDWRFVAGVRVPHLEETFYENPALNSTVQWHIVSTGDPLPVPLFGRPEPRARSGMADGSASSARAAQLVLGRYVFVEGTVNGHPTPILLDSGAGNTVISSAHAEHLGVKGAGALPLIGTTTSQQARIAPGVEVTLGSAQLSNLTVVIADLSVVEKGLGRSVPVILGKEAFNAFAVEIDYPASRVVFHRPETFQPPADAHAVPLTASESGVKLVEARVEGFPPALFVLDTGSGDTVTLFKSYVESNRLLDEREPRSQRWSRGIGGGAAVTIATLRSLTLGGFEMREVPASFYAEDRGAFNTTRVAGNLGAGILGRFRVILHFGAGALYLARTARSSGPFCKDRSGIQADYRDGGLDVVFVAPGSPASQSGWKIGARIIAIDRRPIGPEYPLTIPEWSCGPAGSTVVLTDAAGVHHTLVLAEYY